jgi:uncharacterized protein (TIGR03067 family)
MDKASSSVFRTAWSTAMPDEFQAEPSRRSSNGPSVYDRFAVVNFRKPENNATTLRWARLIAAMLGGGMIALVLFGVLSENEPSTPPSKLPAIASSSPLMQIDRGDFVLIKAEEKKPFQGTWIATALSINGENATDEEVAKVILTIAKDTYTLALPSEQHSGRLESDQSTKPKAMDFIAAGPAERSALAIYSIDGDTLTICMKSSADDQDEGARPTEFTSKRGVTLLVLKRRRSDELSK